MVSEGDFLAGLDDVGNAELRLVRVGEPVTGGLMTVLSGLRAGERILAAPPPGIAAGWSTQQQQQPEEGR